jgi:hypothetical protein
MLSFGAQRQGGRIVKREQALMAIIREVRRRP